VLDPAEARALLDSIDTSKPVVEYEGIARLRQALAQPERRVISGACSIHGHGFSIAYERTDPRSPFKIAAVEKLDPGPGAVATAGNTPARPSAGLPAEAFSSGDFDQIGFTCPWCGSDGGRVFHDRCATNYCGGAKMEDGNGGERFTCPACKVTLQLVIADVIHASVVAADQAWDGGRKLIEQAKRKLLPKWLKARLPRSTAKPYEPFGDMAPNSPFASPLIPSEK